MWTKKIIFHTFSIPYDILHQCVGTSKGLIYKREDRARIKVTWFYQSAANKFHLLILTKDVTKCFFHVRKNIWKYLSYVRKKKNIRHCIKWPSVFWSTQQQETLFHIFILNRYIGTIFGNFVVVIPGDKKI